MKPNCVLVRFGELSTKGKNKSDFIAVLYRNIRRALRDLSAIEINKAHDRIYIYLNGEDAEKVAMRLKFVSGIANFSPAYAVKRDLKAIIETALQLAREQKTGTFKVVARRGDKSFPIHSDEINRAVAGEILRNTECKVDVHHPSFYVKIEVRVEGTFVFLETIKGLGGYPLGVGGKALVLYSGGLDSPVAAFSLMRRGVKIEAIHFASPPYTSDGAIKKVVDSLKVLSRIQGEIVLHIVPFTRLQEAIYDLKDESYAITLMRRMMYRIAERQAFNRNCLCLAGGESIGQVASQTLESMAVINEVIDLPMIRPLAIFDKEEIIDIAKEIGTYDISIRPFIDCCTIFTPKNPVTRPKRKRAIFLESRFDYEGLIEECLSGVKTIVINDEEEVNEADEKFF